MKPTAFLIAIVVLAASASPLLARGQFGGPIGPGSRDGLQPSVNDFRPNALAYEPQRPIAKMRSRKNKRR